MGAATQELGSAGEHEMGQVHIGPPRPLQSRPQLEQPLTVLNTMGGGGAHSSPEGLPDGDRAWADPGPGQQRCSAVHCTLCGSCLGEETRPQTIVGSRPLEPQRGRRISAPKLPLTLRPCSALPGALVTGRSTGPKASQQLFLLLSVSRASHGPCRAALCPSCCGPCSCEMPSTPL